MYTKTQTATFTVTDIRKAFSNFEADLRIIARRTEKLGQELVEQYCHDILVWAEGHYLERVDVVLVDNFEKPIQAARYIINEMGSALSGDRAGGNNWPNLPNSYLKIIVKHNATWHKLDDVNKKAVQVKLKTNWSVTNIDTSYSHLQDTSAQGYASKGYELNKTNFK